MKKLLFLLILVLGISLISFSGKLPIEYQIQKNYHRMKLVLNGDVRWNVSQSDRTFDITLMGNESHFIIKNINYNFRDGVIKRFNYQTSLVGTKKIVVELRNSVNDYHIYQDEISKNLYIEFYPGTAASGIIAKKISGKKAVVAPPKQTVSAQTNQSVVNIPQIVLDQVEDQPKDDGGSSALSTSSVKYGNGSSAALWLILVSISIILTGGGFAVYAFVRRKAPRTASKFHEEKTPAAFPDFKTIMEHRTEPVPQQRMVPGIVISDDEKEFSHSIEYAEQYLRSQGEFELQQRLEHMSSRSTQQKISAAIPSSRKKDPAILAQKLGLSVGELELVTRLQKFHKQHSSEVS